MSVSLHILRAQLIKATTEAINQSKCVVMRERQNLFKTLLWYTAAEVQY